MKTLALYAKPAGAVVNLKLAPNPQVTTFMVFVKQWVKGASQSAGTWLPKGLGSPAGESLTMQKCDGYDFILKAQVCGAPDTAAVTPQLQINGTTVYSDVVNLPAAEGPVVVREWSVVIV